MNSVWGAGRNGKKGSKARAGTEQLWAGCGIQCDEQSLRKGNKPGAAGRQSLGWVELRGGTITSYMNGPELDS